MSANMELHQSPQKTGTMSKSFKSRYQSVCQFFGFEKGYNLPLFIIFGGAMTGFVFARFQVYADFRNPTPAHSSGEEYWFQTPRYRVGFIIHLTCILPAGLLMVLQFIPTIRHRWILFHRISGYIVILLVLISNASALVIARRTFGGDLATQTAFGFLAIITTLGLALAYYNIKCLQIDQHRAWMLRTVFYLACIITQRMIMAIVMTITSSIDSYSVVMSCAELSAILANRPAYFNQTYPSCVSLPSSNVTMLNSMVPIQANIGLNHRETAAASIRLSFGCSVWLAIAIHMVGVEIYLNLTPREARRLREVAYQKQLRAGFKNPGNAGLVVQKFGDADEWVYSTDDLNYNTATA